MTFETIFTYGAHNHKTCMELCKVIVVRNGHCQFDCEEWWSVANDAEKPNDEFNVSFLSVNFDKQ